MLDATELASIRTDANTLLTMPCTIKRKSGTKSAMGQASGTYSVISPAGLMAGMRPPTQQELQNYDYLIGSLATWVVKLPYGTSVQPQDQIIIGTNTLEAQQDLSLHSIPVYQLMLASEVNPEHT